LKGFVMADVVELSRAPARVDPAGTADPVVVEECLARLVAARRAGDPVAVRRCEVAVIERYRPFADRIARRFRGRGVEDDDLVQVARLGLCTAVPRWRPELDPSLLQFAAATIEGQVKRYFRDHCRPIRMPRSAQDDLALHQGAHSDLVQLLRREPTESEIAAAAGSSVARVRSQRLASRVCQPVSADAPTASSLAWLRCDDSSRALGRVDAAVSVGAAVRQLTARERRILDLRFVGELSQTEIAARVGVSQMQVSRLLRSILARLHQRLA
jgi:RNA polymerase sigma-B factor